MAADFDRDYLLPSPTTNCNGCLPSELRYDTAYAVQNRVLYSLRKEGNPRVYKGSPRLSGLRIRLAHILPSCTKALGVPKEERDYLGGWTARGSDTCSRVAVRVISNLQRLVVRALIERPNADPLAEEETILQFESFMCEKGVGPEERAKCFEQLGKDSVSILPELHVFQKLGLLSPSEVLPDTAQLAEMAQDEPRADGRLKNESSRTQVLGDNPKEVRDCARRLLEPGLLRIGFWS